MIDAVAHCAVAISTYPAMDGSASATAAGVIAEFRAVVPTAAPIAFLSFFGRRRLNTKKKITAVAAEIRPSTIPEAPAVRIVLTSVFAPIEIVIKNVTIGCAVAHAFLNPASRLPPDKSDQNRNQCCNQRLERNGCKSCCAKSYQCEERSVVQRQDGDCSCICCITKL